MRLIELP